MLACLGDEFMHSEQPATTDAYFWGCWNGRTGHYLWFATLGRYEPCRHNGVLPWPQIDGALTPGNRAGSSLYAATDNYVRPEEQIEGQAKLHHRDGWTALAWWDRSVDSRHGSNAALFARGTFTADEMLALGRQVFPAAMARFKYQIAVCSEPHVAR